MFGKKILGALAVGAFIFGVPVADIDAPLTNTVSAASSSELRYREQEVERARENYEHEKRRYDKAKNSGGYTSSQLREIKNRRDRAKDRYDEAKERYNNARRNYRDGDDDRRYRSRKSRYSKERRREIYRNRGYLY